MKEKETAKVSNLDTQDKVHSRLQELLEQESTRRDVPMAIELQERLDFDIEELIEGLENDYGWNSNHAREIAERAWVEMYAEKEGE